MRRFLVVPLLILTLMATLSSAEAKGVLFKGRLILTTAPLTQTTGNCTCNANWFTFGVKPGNLTITAALHGYSLPYGTSYGLRLFLYAGARSVGGAQAGCTTKQKKCNQQAVLHAKVKSTTVYYLEIYGPGASLVYYSLRVNAHIKRLHCLKTCS